MSVIISAAVWQMKFTDTSLKLVALSLADQANDEGECWPKIESVSARVELSERSVQRHISNLEACGLLEREARFDGKGHQTSNMYRFNLEKLPPVTHAKPAKKDEKEAVTLSIPHGEEFAKKWSEWEDFRRKAKFKKLQPASVQRQLDALAGLTAGNAVACIELSIRNGWQGLFPERFNQRGTPGAGNRRADATLNRGSTFGRRADQHEELDF